MKVRGKLLPAMLVGMVAAGALLAIGREREHLPPEPSPAAREAPAQAMQRVEGAPDAAAAASRGIAADSQTDLFAAKSWYVPPPPPPPPKPVAPPLPFAFAGKLRDGDAQVIFVARAGRNYLLRPGDVVDGAYRLEAIANGSAVFNYLPLNEKQSLPIGTDN